MLYVCCNKSDGAVVMHKFNQTTKKKEDMLGPVLQLTWGAGGDKRQDRIAFRAHLAPTWSVYYVCVSCEGR